MSQKYINSGKTLVVTAGADVVSGQFIKIGSLVGCCKKDALSGSAVPVDIEGVFDAPKTTGQTWDQGQSLYWDDSAKKFTTGSASDANLPAAVAAYPAGSGAATAPVLLFPGIGGIVAAIANRVKALE